MRIGWKLTLAAMAAVAIAAFFGIEGRCEEPLPKRLSKDEVAKILAGEPATGEFRFVVIGDTRDGDAVYNYFIDLAGDMAPKFIINLGDFVHSGARDQYLHYYDQIAKSKVPVISVIGNHEVYDDGGYHNYLEMFGETDFYFDYGGLRFIILDNSGALQYGLKDEQIAWLEKALQTDNQKLVFMHAPPRTRLWEHSMGDDKNNEEFMRLVERYDVPKVYVGHMHAYDRFRRGGTQYVISGGGGAEPDPVTVYYDKLGGGYYHYLLVDVRKEKTMDILVEPANSDLMDFIGPDGDGLELPYGTYRHYNTPVVESLEALGGPAKAGAATPVKITASSHPKAMEVGLRGISVDCIDGAGRKYGGIALQSEVKDERSWKGELPAMAAGKAECYVSATDASYSRFVNVPPLEKLDANGSRNPSEIPYRMLAEDFNDSILKVSDELDILETAFAYDADYYYLRLKVEGGFNGGSKTYPRNMNVYALGLLDENFEVHGELNKLLTETEVLIYAPFAPSMGMYDCGLLNIQKFRDGDMNVAKKGVKCKAEGDTLHMRVDRSVYGKDFEGAKFLAATIKVILEPKLNVDIGDAADIVQAHFGGFPIEIQQ